MPVVTASIICDDVPMPPWYRLQSIDVRSEVNRIPTAELRLIDGTALSKYEVTDGTFFALGTNVVINMRYENSPDTSMFEGIVVRQTLAWGAEGSMVVVELKDIAVKLTASRKSAVYEHKTDDMIIEQLLNDAKDPRVKKGMIAPTSIMHSSMVQYDCTPWDFICLRAEALGMLVTADAGAVSLTPMTMTIPPDKLHTFTWGTNIYEFEVEAAAEHPYAAVASLAWNSTANTLTAPTAGASTAAPPGNLVPTMIANKVGRDNCQIKHAVPAEEGELKAWADARLSRSILATVRGRVSIPGKADIKVLDTITVVGIGQRFSGNVLVTAVHHRYDRSGWRTELQFGLSPDRLCQRENIAEIPAAGLLPPVRGLQIGVVAAFKNDPKGELRVKVNLPGIDDKPAGDVWARLATMDAGANRGTYFRPEEGDEVVVGFLFDDPRHPVILGSMFGSKNKIPDTFGAPDGLNQKKGIVTKKGTTLEFTDRENPSARLMTIGKVPNSKKSAINSVVIHDGSGITLKDQYGNSIVMSKEGITIGAGSGTVSIKGGMVNVDKSMGMANQAGQS